MSEENMPAKEAVADPVKRLEMEFLILGVIAGAFGGAKLVSLDKEKMRQAAIGQAYQEGLSAQTKADRDAIKADYNDHDAMEAQIYDQVFAGPRDFISIGFVKLAQKNPWLSQLRKSVGLYETNVSSGSAVLLDRDGTVVLCAHEKKPGSAAIVFSPKLGVSPLVEVLNQTYDKEHDLMFGSISPDFIQQYGLVPVEAGSIGYSGTAREVIALGFAAPSLHLHATAGTVRSFRSEVAVSTTSYVNNKEVPGSEKYMCKIHAQLAVFKGMSGGGVFSQNKFIGIMSAGDFGADAQTDFTPSDFVYESYARLYPARAAKIKLPPAIPAPPAACRFDRRQFLGLTNKPG